MPLLFLGHGSPMNAIEENQFVDGFRKVAATLPRPKAILCISAHWETDGTRVTAMEHPKTIHDFGGFPDTLYRVMYPAPGDPELAQLVKSLITTTEVIPDYDWGLDHGTWSVLRHLYPLADIPVIQLSLDYTQDPRYHYQLAKALAPLREQGVLIVGSGNIVHNLGLVSWEHMTDPYGYDWALEAQSILNGFILEGNHEALINYKDQGLSVSKAIPTPEHFLPLLYILALKGKEETVTLFNDVAVAGSLTMTCVKID